MERVTGCGICCVEDNGRSHGSCHGLSHRRYISYEHAVWLAHMPAHGTCTSRSTIHETFTWHNTGHSTAHGTACKAAHGARLPRGTARGTWYIPWPRPGVSPWASPWHMHMRWYRAYDGPWHILHPMAQPMGRSHIIVQAMRQPIVCLTSNVPFDGTCHG